MLGYSGISLDEELGANQLILSSKVVLINNAIIEETINIRKQFIIKIPDAIIAATAIVNDFTLISANEKDFSKVPGLKLINPLLL